jgi:hypothetical protein
LTGRLRLGAWLVCLGLIGAGLYVALLTPAAPVFDKVQGRIHDITVETVATPTGHDRNHEISVTGAPCGDYDYLESWAKEAGLPVITDLNANEPVTIYTDRRSCAGFGGGGHGRLLAIVYQGKLYATPGYRLPRSGTPAGLPAALLLLLIGAAGTFLLVRRTLNRGAAEPLR